MKIHSINRFHLGSSGFGKGDQKNILWFALGLGIPGILISLFGLLVTSWGHPWLMFFDAFLLVFIAWTIRAVYKICQSINRLSAKKPETIYCFDWLEDQIKKWHTKITRSRLETLTDLVCVKEGDMWVFKDHYGQVIHPESLSTYHKEKEEYIEYLVFKYSGIIPIKGE